MAILGTSDRTAIGAVFQSDASGAREPLGAVVKADIQAAIAAADDWVVANAASYNAALPVAVRTAFSAAQKSRLLMYVLRRRYETGA
jgi:hypothetical protein